MLNSFTAVLERNTVLSGEFATEPYETAWALEARWFVQVLETSSPDTAVRAVTEVSPDGLTWVPLDELEHVQSGTGVSTWSVREFGGWLRIRGRVDGEGDTAKVRIYLSLKG